MRLNSIPFRNLDLVYLRHGLLNLKVVNLDDSMECEKLGESSENISTSVRLTLHLRFQADFI